MYFSEKDAIMNVLNTEEGKSMARKYRPRRKTRFLRRVRLYMRVGVFVLISLMVVLIGMKFFEIGPFSSKYVERDDATMRIKQPEIDVDLLTVNPYSRPGTQSDKINNIVVHYTANPGTSAGQNRNYFEGLKDSKQTRASSHFIVGIDGEIVQCVPTWEIAYASNDRNSDTISIETCHKKSDGAYTKETYDSLVHLTAWLCEKFGLTEEDVIRHYDITGKICPKYFVDNEEAWTDFKEDVKKMLEES